jgi:hypothetical protein
VERQHLSENVAFLLQQLGVDLLVDLTIAG